MKPKDVLPDKINSVEKEGVVVRKGTIGAFTENIRIIESTNQNRQKYKESVADLLELVPALQKLSFFDFYKIKFTKVRALIKKHFKNLFIF